MPLHSLTPKNFDATALVQETPPSWAHEMTEADSKGASVATPFVPQQLALFQPEELEPAPPRPARRRGRLKALLNVFDERKGRGQDSANDASPPSALPGDEPALVVANTWPNSFFDE